MKFARYLKETQTPEWKRAYIDYRGLKKRITAIRITQDGLMAESPSASRTRLSKASASSVDMHSESPRQSVDSEPIHELPESSGVTVVRRRNESTVSGPSDSKDVDRDRPQRTKEASMKSQGPSKSASSQRNRVVSPSSSRLSRRQPSRIFSIRSPGSLRRPPNPFTSPITLASLLPLLSPQELSFFNALDAEFEKIESFYLNREREMVARTHALEVQISELAEHRKRFYAAKSKKLSTWATASNAAKIKPKLANGLDRLVHGDLATKESEIANEADIKKEKGKRESDVPTARLPNPDEYQQAKKALKKAVVEHYRALETLNNYRILNVTGIRKALKKFEKTTKIPAQEAYMNEKVNPSALATDKTVAAMMKEMEEIYAERFVQGDKKKAMVRLRKAPYKSHHFSTFRSGIMIGLALPALVAGVYHSFQEDVREDIPGWDGLLLVYGVCLVPVLFSLLVGLNLLVWARARINYVFIFELDLRTRLDHREYFEIPAFLFLTLCYAFWLSFAQIGEDSVSPTTWPLAWLGLAAVMLLDPLPLLFKSSRFWLARRTGKLFLSGTQTVEFTDFWLGDQFCSLTFTLANVFLVACSYARGFDEDWRKCGAESRYWPVAFSLAMFPLLVRFVQSLKRYADSRLVTHLINGGKYGSGIIAYFFYFLWRHQGGRHNAIFALWCLFSTIYAIYASIWDSMMDWSLLQVHVKHPLLRNDVVYSGHIGFYYFALISNILIRFIWVIYIPSRGPDFYLRTFIVGLLEVLRRWQWNFFRLENEHLGNVDQYRITREVPLPYAFDIAHDGEEDDDDDDDELNRLN